MNATVEIDKSGRLVIPKDLRNALNLVPGTRLSLRREGQCLVIEHAARPRGLYMKGGLLVYESGIPLAPDHGDWVHQDREARAEELWTQGQKA